MPNYLEYQQSIAKEFLAYEKRVGNLIDNAHHAEEGRYKEIILMNYLKRILPQNFSVGTGFVRSQEELTTQIDIIIYDNSYPLLFSEGDFIVAVPQGVVGIIEVKTTITSSDICNVLKKSNSNGSLIYKGANIPIFNGIFAFNKKNDIKAYIKNLENFDFTLLKKRKTYEIIPPDLMGSVNHIALGNNYFIKLWKTGQDEYEADIDNPYYSVYHMKEGLAFSYLFSNIQEYVLKNRFGNSSINVIPEELKEFLYPIPNGKESNLKTRIYL